MGKNRYFQVIRGICIIAVVLIHVSFPNLSEELNFYEMTYRNVINFAVAVFIFLSGYFVKLENVNSKWVYKRLVRILIPYAIWTVFYLAIKIVAGFSFSPKDIFVILVSGGAAAPLYYLVVLTQLILLTPILKKILFKGVVTRYILFSITPLWLGFLYAMAFVKGIHLPFYHVVFTAWISFYCYGVYVREKSKNTDTVLANGNHIAILILSLLGVLVFSNFESIIIYKYTGLSSVAKSQLTFGSALYSLVVIRLIMTLERYYVPSNRINIAEKIGNYSFGIFLFHIAVLSGVVKVISLVNMPDYLYILYQLIVGTTTIVLSYILLRLISKIIGSTLTSYLGIK